jgi:hypothetical protein
MEKGLYLDSNIGIIVPDFLNNNTINPRTLQISLGYSIYLSNNYLLCLTGQQLKEVYKNVAKNNYNTQAWAYINEGSDDEKYYLYIS